MKDNFCKLGKKHYKQCKQFKELGGCYVVDYNKLVYCPNYKFKKEDKNEY